MVGPVAAELAALSDAPIFAKFVAAVVISSGGAITLDISVLRPRGHQPIGMVIKEVIDSVGKSTGAPQPGARLVVSSVRSRDRRRHKQIEIR